MLPLLIKVDLGVMADIGLGVRVLANGPGDLGSIPGRVIPKTQKMVLDASLLNTQHYKVRIKGKVEQSREGVAPSPIPWCSSYRKGSLRVTLDYGRQLYFLLYIFPKAPILEPQHQIVLCHLSWGGGLNPQQRCSWCVLLPPPVDWSVPGKRQCLHCSQSRSKRRSSRGFCSCHSCDIP